MGSSILLVGYPPLWTLLDLYKRRNGSKATEIDVFHIVLYSRLVDKLDVCRIL